MADSVTKTTESGAFVRVTIRHGKERTQKTRRMTPNDEKVIIGHIGDFEVYVYPYKFPDTAFIGAYPVSTAITPSNTAEVMAAYNKITWFLNGEWQNDVSWRKGPKSRGRAIRTAYDNGLKRLITSKQGGKRL